MPPTRTSPTFTIIEQQQQVVHYMLIMLSDIASTMREKFNLFLVISLLVTGSTRSAVLEQGKCPDERFVECENGECIKRFDVCDGIANCSDGSDESQPICMEGGCPARTFRCAYGACIDESLKCNGKHDCADQSDELSMSPSCGLQWLTNASPPCRTDQFQCRNGECIPGSNMCDGEVNCSDRSDESILACYGGKMSNCPLGSFRCAYGGCISTTKMCNSKNDCADGSDEHHLLCNRPKPQTSPVTSTKPPGRQCIVPDDDHSSYSRLGCKLEDCLLKKGEAVNDNEHFLLNCQRPYVRPDDVLVVRCSNGEWQPPKHTCQKNCKPLVSTSLIIECELNGQKVNCNEEVPPATDAGYKCRDGYETKESFLQQSTNRCLPNGKWLYKPLPHCYYRCGILNKPEEQKLNPLIHDGVDTIATNHPWNVGLYYFDRRNNTYNMFCGGTLISPFTVLSAAHCFINDDTAERLNANDVWITLGKTERNWSTIEDGVQRIQLENYHIPDKYAGRNISFLNDVAVLTLRTQASISRTHGPMPACLAKSKNKLDRGSIGLLSGWGEIHGEYPETLQAANLTFQPYAYCREHANSTISADHFCTYNNEVNGSISQPTVSAGDSGSGFMYKINNNHFVYGVTSTRTSTNYGFTLSTFTDLTHTSICNFVKTQLELINEMHKNFPFSPINC